MIEAIKAFLNPYSAVLKIGLLVAVAGGMFSAGALWNGKRIQTKWDASEKVRAEAEVKAVSKRLSENAALAEAQAKKAAIITKGLQDEITRLNRAYANVGKLRVKMVCPSATVSGTPQSSGGIDARTTGELPSKIAAGLYGIAQDADRSVLQCKALQEWVKANGMN